MSLHTAGPLVLSEQCGAEHAENCRDDTGLKEEPHNTTPQSTVCQNVQTQEEFLPTGRHSDEHTTHMMSGTIPLQ